jgi:hypothetical protein
MASPRRGILGYAVFLIEQQRRRMTPIARVSGCRVCGERLRKPVELLAGWHIACRPRPWDETGGADEGIEG